VYHEIEDVRTRWQDKKRRKVRERRFDGKDEELQNCWTWVHYIVFEEVLALYQLSSFEHGSEIQIQILEQASRKLKTSMALRVCTMPSMTHVSGCEFCDNRQGQVPE
jgi:hypothetical protein